MLKTCLLMIWKLLVGIISEKLVKLVETNDTFSLEQEGYCRCAVGAKNHLMVTNYTDGCQKKCKRTYM